MTVIRYLAQGGLLLCVLLVAAGCPKGEVITFPDEQLELAIRTELRIPFGFITRGQMLDLVSLDGRNFEIRDLRGLEAALNLTRLDVSSEARMANSVQDIAPLAELTNLRFLNLENNDVSDITPVSGLFNLDELLLAGNPVYNIGALVANAENGGLGPGDTVTLSEETLLDENGETSAIIVDQLNRLLDAGVDVVFVEFL